MRFCGVFRIDVNSAFLSWEAVYRLAHKGRMQDLREIASAVGGDMALRHGIILAKSAASCHLFGQPEEVAEQIKDHIRER